MASNEIEVPGSTATVGKLTKLAAGRALNRRHFLAALGMTSAAAGAGLVGCSATSSTVVPTTAGSGQVNVLNFILNFKYLEATFYAYVTTGNDLAASLTAGSGAVTNAPAKLTFTGTNASQITDMLNEIYYDEKNHVTTLLNLLGVSAVPRPAINLGAYAAITATNALSVARLLEDVGVTAIAGSMGSLTTSNLTFASQILGVESFHAGAIRLVSIQNPTIAAYAKADSSDVAPIDLGSASAAAAGPTASGGMFATAGATTSSATTPAGFAFTRPTAKVLAIAYGTGGVPAASGATSGGFFPSGIQGVINSA